MEAAVAEGMGWLRHQAGMGVMKAQEFKNLRQRLGLERLVFARLIGFTGTDRNDVTRIRQYEGSGRSSKQVPLHLARYAWMLEEHFNRTGKFPMFPDWPGYDHDHSPDPEHQKGSKNGAEFY